MSFKNKRSQLILSAFMPVVLVGVIFASSVFPAKAAGTALTGYIYSENVGWFVMNDTTNGGNVQIQSDGTITGGAWSENVGWLDFNPLGLYPEEPLNPAKVIDGVVSGWGKIQTADSASGWVSFSGVSTDNKPYKTTYNSTTQKLEGAAWSDDFGWLDFSQICKVDKICNSANGEDSINCPGDCKAPSNLKPIRRTTAESLVFTESKNLSEPSMELKKGVASISVDGVHWQRSIAEILHVGVFPAILKLEKTDGKSFVSPGDTNNYVIRFRVISTGSSLTYNATITDNLITETTADKATLSAPVGGYKYCFDNSGVETCANAPNVFSASSVTFNLSGLGLLVGTEYYIKTNATIANDITQNSKVVNTVNFVVNGTTATATDTDIVASAYAQEDFGGDIYAKGALNLGDPNLSGANTGYNAKYIIAADGTISPTNQSQSIGVWKVPNYTMRPGSGSDLGNAGPPNTCIDGSACKVMQENIDRLIKVGEIKTGVTAINTSNPILSDSPPTANPPPEGKVWVFENGLTISGSDKIKGKGTIIIKSGNLYINSDLIYNSTKDIFGFIVVNGDVVINSSVKEVDGIFYVPNGIFKTGDSPDNILTLKGVFVARGFDLGRGAIGEKPIDIGLRIDIVPHGRLALDNPNDGFSEFCKLVTGISTAVGSCKEAPSDLGEYDYWKLPVAPATVGSFVYYGGGSAIMSAACEVVNCVKEKLPAEIFLYDARILFTPPPGFGGKFLRSLN